MKLVPFNFAAFPIRFWLTGSVAGVLQNVSEEIRECYQHAEDCARRAAAERNPRIKQDFLDMQQRWLRLARSFEFAQRLNTFVGKVPN